MNKISHLEQVDYIGKLADLKEQHYQNTLILSAMLELLLEKGLLTHQDIEQKAAQLDEALTLHSTYPTE
ncbi:hypothetical protein EHS13_35715 [Paenibacillus psychroresistens]|uniref:Nitrile hydratase subunit beta n=1 Tax=Paenibacillus psychroresistens TaxID=1778678 RepID=A0A6B8RXH2_9BACL|nr:hypothetical protein [Paenibacillus psychroresistens]QGQ99836.1 hypothetical protein EHS13_35715 [Paenibacillus psychroresistens]